MLGFRLNDVDVCELQMIDWELQMGGAVVPFRFNVDACESPTPGAGVCSRVRCMQGWSTPKCKGVGKLVFRLNDVDVCDREPGQMQTEWSVVENDVCVGGETFPVSRFILGSCL